MSEEEKQEGQKTVVAFVAGLLIGGLLVWVFGGSTPATEEIEEATETLSEEAAEVAEEGAAAVIDAVELEPEPPAMEVGDGSIDVSNQAAGSSVTLDSATFPVSEGWVAVRSYNNGQLGSILGAARFSETQGLVPENVPLLAPTTPGRTYAVVFFTEDGNRQFNLSGDVQIDGVFSTFEAE